MSRFAVGRAHSLRRRLPGGSTVDEARPGHYRVEGDVGPRTLSAIRVTVTMALAATLFNAVYGLLLAWVLVRYRFPGKSIVDAFVDLPFALPTAVAGIALTALYSPNGWIGQCLPFKVSFTPLGVFVALTFIGLP